MKINDLSLGEISAGNERRIPDNSARTIQNMVVKNNQYVTRKAIDTIDSGLNSAITAEGTPSKVWAWKPSVRIDGRGDYYYFVLYSDYSARLFRYQNGWQSFGLGINFNSNAKITIYASPMRLLISDGLSKPLRIIINADGTADSDELGVISPDAQPILSNAKYTDEDDQNVFSEVGFVRVAYTFVDGNGIESNPSPLSNAYNAQRFKYIDGVQQNYISSITVSNIDVTDEEIKSVKFYTELTSFSEGGDVSVFSFASEYPVSQELNSFTLYNSGSETFFLSYENDTLNAAGNITETGGVIFLATGDQPYNFNKSYRYLQPIKLQNVNGQTFVDKPIRLRLYSHNYPGGTQNIPNFNAGHFAETSDFPYIRLYDDDKTTPLDVFYVEYDTANIYIEVIAKMTIKSAQTKTIYLAFTPDTVDDRKKYAGGLAGAFGNDNAMANKVFRNIDVINADTKIACYLDDTIIDGEDIGELNFADSELTADGVLAGGTTSNYFYIPYINYKNGITTTIPQGSLAGYSLFNFDPDISPRSYTLMARFGLQTQQDLTSELHLLQVGSGDDTMFIEVAYNNTTKIMTFSIDGASGDEVGILSINIDQFRRDIGAITIFDFLLVWSVKRNADSSSNDDQEHTLYVYPIYNNANNQLFPSTIYGYRGENEVTQAIFGYDGAGRYRPTVTQAIFTQNLFLENSVNNKAAIRCYANYMPLYLTDVIGAKFTAVASDGNSNFSLGEQVDFDNLGNYFNYRIRWSDKNGESFPDLNYHPLLGANTILIPVRGFYNNQYVPTILSFTDNTISRIVLDDVTNQIASANQMVTEYSGYGCSDDNLIDVYGDVVFWYSSTTKHVYMYDGNNIKNLSEGRIELDDPTLLFVNNTERQVIIVDSDKQYIYSIEYNLFTSATGMDIVSASNDDDGVSLLVRDGGRVRKYPSESPTNLLTIIETKTYRIDRQLLHRIRPIFSGDFTTMKTTVTRYGNEQEEIDSGIVTSYEPYGINARANFFKINLTGITAFEEIDAELRKL